MCPFMLREGKKPEHLRRPGNRKSCGNRKKKSVIRAKAICYNESKKTGALKTYMERQWSLVAGMAEPFQEMK